MEDHPLQEILDDLVHSVFPWECSKRRFVGERNGTMFQYVLDPQVSIRFIVQGDLTSALMEGPETDFEEVLDTSEWTDFVGWVSIAAATYAEWRERKPAEFLASMNINFRLVGETNATYAFAKGSTVSLNPSAGVIWTTPRLDRGSEEKAVDKDFLHRHLAAGEAFLTPAEWLKKQQEEKALQASKRPPKDAEVRFKFGDPKERTRIQG